MVRSILLAGMLLAPSVAFAGQITYVAVFSGPDIDGTLVFDPVRFERSADPQYSVGGGILTLREPTGRRSEANIHTTFDVTGDFRASVTADLTDLGTRGFDFGMYEYTGGAMRISTNAFPGGNIFSSALLNTQSYISNPNGGVQYAAVSGGSPFITFGIARVGNTLNTYLNGVLFNTGAYETTNPSRFLISLCGSSCYEPTNPGEDNIARISDFRITYNVRGGVPEPSAWALLIVGFGMVGAGLRRRVAAPRLA